MIHRHRKPARRRFRKEAQARLAIIDGDVHRRCVRSRPQGLHAGGALVEVFHLRHPPPPRHKSMSRYPSRRRAPAAATLGPAAGRPAPTSISSARITSTITASPTASSGRSASGRARSTSTSPWPSPLPPTTGGATSSHGAEPRLRSSIVVPYEDGASATKEIERCAPNPAYAEVFMLTRTSDPAGNRRYWPIYEAAERNGLPVALHVFGAGGHPYTGAGWPSLLRRGGCRPFHLLPDGGDEPRHRGRHASPS